MVAHEVQCPACRESFTLPSGSVGINQCQCPLCQCVFVRSAGPENSLVPGEGADSENAAATAAGKTRERPHITLMLYDFQLVKKLGAGGMGEVYLARQPSQQRQVALKILSPAGTGVDKCVARFYREALALATLQHPNIVAFYGVGREKKTPFLAMEFIEGLSTATIVRAKGKLTTGDALYIILKCVDALNYALSRNLIHRDIKPENIMLNTLGYVKIADLGLAKSVNEDADLTDSGVTLGSPRFMAPEQARNAKHADHRSDIYSLGAVLYYYLTGVAPFKGESPMELLLAKEKGVYPPASRLNRDIHPRLDTILDKMLARVPAQRYQSYPEVKRDLEALGLHHPHLQFNILHVASSHKAAETSDALQILLIDDDLRDIVLAQQALEEHHIHANFTVARDAAEALSYLQCRDSGEREPSPNLIVLGIGLHDSTCMGLIKEIQASPRLARVPLVVLAPACDVEFLEENGIHVTLTVKRTEDLLLFDNLVQSTMALSLTVAERR